MVASEQLGELAWWTHVVLREQVVGTFVECGVWRGGASFLVARLLQRADEADRRVWMFDSFEGLPPPTDVDGDRAHRYSTDVQSPAYFDNCRAEYDDVLQAAQALGVQDVVKPIKGWFADTLPQSRQSVGPIALLRIDCDWYEPVLCCLENLYDQLSPGAFVIIDDYYVWDGCAIAVHEFLARRRLPHRIFSATGEAYFRK